MAAPDNLVIYEHCFSSRFWLGTAQYPSPAILQAAVQAAQPALLTASLRREAGSGQGGQGFWSLLQECGRPILPNTAACYSAKEAITTAHMARELFKTPWIKLEVIANADTLQPDVVGLLEAAQVLIQDGFQVFPYTTEDLSIAERLLALGCEVLMPWGAPIGSGRGLNNPYGLRSLRAHFPDVPLIIDAGIGRPSQAVAALEMGFDAILLNTAVTRAGDPIAMAQAFATAIQAGRSAYWATPIPAQDMASPSTPVFGKGALA